MALNETSAGTLLRTALYDEHKRLGARMVPFAGYEMPVQYTGVIEEHNAVRQRAGMFDVSHMGRFEVHGPDAGRFLRYISTWDMTRLQPGEGHYSAACREDGGILDDIYVFCLDARALSHRRQRLQRPEDEGLDGRAHREVGRAPHRPPRLDRDDRRAGPGRARPPQRAHRRRLRRRTEAATLRRDRVARTDALRLAHRLHRRGRPRARHRRRSRPRPLARAPRRRRHSPPASARATRCVSKRRCSSTATTWTKKPTPGRSASTG